MSPSKDQKAAKRRRRRQAGRSPLHASGLPRPLRLVLESFERFDQYAGVSDNPTAAVALAEAQVLAGIDRIVALADACDAFDVLELIRLHNTFANPETFKEAEHEGSASIIELVALVLAARGSRGAATHDTTKRPEEIIDEVQIAARDAINAGSMLLMFRSALDPHRLQRLSFGTVLREVALRNVAYVHMVEDTLSGLFDAADTGAMCAAVMGCTVRQIRAVFTTLQTLHEEGWAERFAALRALGELVIATGGREVIPQEVADRGRELLDQAWNDPSRCSMFTVEVVAQRASIPAAVVGTVLDLFSLPMMRRNAAEAALEFFQGRSPLRVRPILRDPDGTMVVVHTGLLIPAVRERVEEALVADQRSWDVYSKRRGDYLERAAIDLIAVHLPGCAQHPGLEYFVPNADTETAPDQFTKLVEGDGLLVLDDVAVIIEAKAVSMRAQSRTGQPARLRRDLHRIVTEAADQGERMRRRILDDGGLRLRDGTWLDLSAVREVHTIAVSLEDLSGIATVTSDMVTAGLLTANALPWTVSIHDLRIVSELVDRPIELLAYLRRRTEPDITRRFHAVDELDFFMYFLAHQLYAQTDPAITYAELPHLGPPRVRDERRYRRQALEFVASRTDPLDAWYMHQLGVRQTEAAKPTFQADADLLRLIDELARRADPGWLAMAATMADCDTPTQRRFARMADSLAEKSRADGLPHSVAIPGGTRRGNSFLFIWTTLVPGTPISSAHDHLARYVTAKKHQLQLDRALGMLIDSENGDLLATVYDNRRPGAAPNLDVEVTTLRLRAASIRHGMPPRRNGRK